MPKNTGPSYTTTNPFTGDETETPRSVGMSVRSLNNASVVSSHSNTPAFTRIQIRTAEEPPAPDHSATKDEILRVLPGGGLQLQFRDARYTLGGIDMKPGEDVAAQLGRVDVNPDDAPALPAHEFRATTRVYGRPVRYAPAGYEGSTSPAIHENDMSTLEVRPYANQGERDADMMDPRYKRHDSIGASFRQMVSRRLAVSPF